MLHAADIFGAPRRAGLVVVDVSRAGGALVPLLLLCAVSSTRAAPAPAATATSDKTWSAQHAALAQTLEAEYIVRVGDVDNLGFGWPEGFDPFCGRMTEVHAFPWQPKAGDVAGLDRILLSSKFRRGKEPVCGGDGYSESFDPRTSRPTAIAIPTTTLRGAKVTNAFLQVFLDDFQARSFCSRFLVTLNGRRFAEAERLLHAIDQSGPVGKLVTIPLPEEFWPELTSGKPLRLLVDESSGAADGFAMDFVRVLVNRRRDNTCRGRVAGRVVDDATGEPIAKARVALTDRTATASDGEGAFAFSGVPTGFEIVTAAADGYEDGSAGADVGPGDDNPEVEIRLKKAKLLDFAGRQVKVGEALQLSNILFDLAKAELKPASLPELDKVVALMRAYPHVEIELSGHTSAEGEAAMNRSLSYRRVLACKAYLVSKGIDAGRIVAIGYGPDRPAASNETEEGRRHNRRVELRIVRAEGAPAP